MTGFVLNPPRRRKKARRSARKGRRRNARGWFHKKTAGSRVAYSRPSSRKSNPKRKRRRSRSRSRRHNPGALYALNPRRRRKSRKSRRRRNPGALYALNGSRRKRRSSRRRRNPGLLSGGIGGLVANVPQVVGFRVPLPGVFGKVANGIVQGGAAGAVVFGGFILSNLVINKVDEKLRKADGTPVLTKFQKPILFAAASGLAGTVMRMGSKFLKGNPALWFILGAAGPGLAAVATLIDMTMNKEKSAAQGGIVYRINKIASGLADYVQVGEEVSEAGVGDYVQTEDYIQTDGFEEAGVGEEEEVEEMFS